MSSPRRSPRSDSSRRGLSSPTSAVVPPSSSSPMRDSSPRREDDEDEGEDIHDDAVMANDYRAIAELDSYEAADLDQGDYDAMDMGDRAAAERELKKRDMEEMRRAGAGVAALMTPSEDEMEPPRRRRRIAEEQGDAEAVAEYEEDEGGFINLDEFKGPLAEWLTLDSTRNEIKRRFRQFLSDFRTEDGHHVYPKLISEMCSENKQSLEVSYMHLSHAVPILAIWVADEPEAILELFNEEALAVVLTMFPNYHNVHSSVYVRLTKLPVVDSLRDLRQVHLNGLIKVAGVVTRRTAVFPQLQKVKYNCGKCGFLLGPYLQNGVQEVTPGRCPECQSNGPFITNSEETIYQNYQKITLQETPGSVPAGRVPRQKDVILLHDIIDSVSPGEDVEITGVYKHQYDPALNSRNGFPVFSTVIQANYVTTNDVGLSSFKITDEDTKKILKLSKDPNVADRIFRSVAPSIYGHENIKMGVTLAMFGGVAKHFENKHRIRGDINVLIMGDPGTGKSQFLKYVEKTAHRAVYTTGKGASAVGLTASVRADPITREWTLEGGALVLADNGVCMIDEFDKMNDQDRTSIHEAMEQQSISISKAGIITTLKARCSVIAAANPIGGRYDSQQSFAENVELTDAILSRFDVLCVVRDTVDRDLDARLAGFVVKSHMKSHPRYGMAEDDEQEKSAEELAEEQREAEEAELEKERTKDHIPQDLLRKYILYAKQTCEPKLHNVDDDKISKLYADLRRESQNTGGIPIAVRHIESIIRMSEAHAKMHLREFVTEEDVNMAIRVMLESFISTQKFAVMRSLRKHFQKYMTYKKDTFELLNFALNGLVNDAIKYREVMRASSQSQDEFSQQSQSGADQPVVIDEQDFRAKAGELQISNLNPFYKSKLFKSRYKRDAKAKTITRHFGDEA